MSKSRAYYVTRTITRVSFWLAVGILTALALQLFIVAVWALAS